MIKITILKKTIDLLDSELIIKRFLLKRHEILKFIRDQNDIGIQVTNKDIQTKFGLYRKAINKHLRILKEREYIIYSKYIENGKKIHIYNITEKARIHLKYILKYLNGSKTLEDIIDILNLISLANTENFFNGLKNHYMMYKEHWSRLRESQLFLTIEQMEQAYGNKNYLYDVQLDEMYKDLIVNEFHFRNIALITSCNDPNKIFEPINLYSQITVNLD